LFALPRDSAIWRQKWPQKKKRHQKEGAGENSGNLPLGAWEAGKSFYEAVQSFWFIWIMIASGTTPGGRFDQYMYPFYKKDKAEGKITDEDVLELLESLALRSCNTILLRRQASAR